MMDYEHYFRIRRDKNLEQYDYTMDFYNLIDLDYEFIRYYEINGNILIIHLSNRIIEVPYDEKIEMIILEKMKEQIETFKKKIEDTRTNGALMYAYIFNSSLYLFITFITRNYLNLITSTIWLSASSIYGIPYINKKIKLNDIQKHTLFLENEDKINEMIKYKMLELGLTDKEAINLTPEFESYATINDIHFLKMDEAKSLVNDNISKDLIYKLKKEL